MMNHCPMQPPVAESGRLQQPAAIVSFCQQSRQRNGAGEGVAWLEIMQAIMQARLGPDCGGSSVGGDRRVSCIFISFEEEREMQHEREVNVGRRAVGSGPELASPTFFQGFLISAFRFVR